MLGDEEEEEEEEESVGLSLRCGVCSGGFEVVLDSLGVTGSGCAGMLLLGFSVSSEDDESDDELSFRGFLAASFCLGLGFGGGAL